MGNRKNAKRKKDDTTQSLLPIRKESKRGLFEGRKPAITPAVLEKLRTAFLMGCDDEEACLFAGITPNTLYNHQNSNETFLQWKNTLKQNPFLLARKTIVDNLERDPEYALKYMERKKKKEFSPTAKLTIEDNTQDLDDDAKATIGNSLAEHFKRVANNASNSG